MTRARLSYASQILAHVPDLADAISEALRSQADAARHLPNQIFLGAHEPLRLSRGRSSAPSDSWLEVGRDLIRREVHG